MNSPSQTELEETIASATRCIETGTCVGGLALERLRDAAQQSRELREQLRLASLEVIRLNDLLSQSASQVALIEKLVEVLKLTNTQLKTHLASETHMHRRNISNVFKDMIEMNNEALSLANSLGFGKGAK